MRHQKHRYRLQRPTAARKALLRSLSAALINNGRIVTTLTKAKALRMVVEPLITLGKKADLNARRRALQILPDKKTVHKLFSEVAPGFKDRNGGYTRIMKLNQRIGDAAPMAIIELVTYAEILKERREKQAKELESEPGNKKGFGQRIKDKLKTMKKTESEELAVEAVSEVQQEHSVSTDQAENKE
ncbi:MAG: 50S ribosomal protein L17 [Candidatus Schekmanbacteria bacterium]|nr:50S ribosomal protein L17 [Candidatus Schekmanbacteria bacterium]